MHPKVPDTSSSGPWFWVVPAGLVGLAAVIRAIGLADRPLWLDEALSVLYAQLDPATLFELRRRGTNPPLYHLLLSYWVGLFGSSEAALRSLSVIAGTAAPAVVYLLARSVGGTMVGLLSAGLLAVNSLAVGYSQEARYYALVELLAVAGSLLLRLAVVTGRGKWMVCYAALMVVFVWTHTFAWFVLAAHITAVVWTVRASSPFPASDRRRLALRFGLAVAVVVASFTPWTGILFSQVRTVLGGYWIPRPEAVTLLACAHAFVVPLEALRWPTVAAAALGMLYIWRRRRMAAPVWRDTHVAQFDWIMLGSWATLPICVPLLWSLVGTPIFQVKYALVAQPAVLILLSLLFVRRPATAMFIIALFTAAHAPAVNRGLQVEDWRQAAAIIEAEGRPGKPIYICQDYTYYALVYYLDESKYPVTPVIMRGSTASDFAEVYPRGPLRYEPWLDRLRHDDQAWVVLSRLRLDEAESGFEQVLADLQKLGSVRVWSVRGDVDVLYWQRQVGRRGPTPRGRG